MIDWKRQGQDEEKLMKFAENHMMLWDNNDELTKALIFIVDEPKGELEILGDFLIRLGGYL